MTTTQTTRQRRTWTWVTVALACTSLVYGGVLLAAPAVGTGWVAHRKGEGRGALVGALIVLGLTVGAWLLVGVIAGGDVT